MEERYPQPAPGPSSYPPQPVTYPPPSQQQYYQAPSAPARVARRSRFGALGRVMRLLLRRSMYGGALLGRALWPYRITIALILPLLAAIAALSVALMWDRIVVAGPSFTRADSIEPGEEVLKFLDGQRTYDAEKMWESFSDEFKASLLDRGASVTTLKEQAENEKLAGQSYLKPTYIGGVRLKTGGAMYFYLVDVKSPRADRNGPTSYVFTVDTKGKIERIE